MNRDADLDALAARLGPLEPAPETPFDPDRLIAWHHGALDPTEAAEVEALLAADPDARAFVADLAEAPSPFLTRWAESRLRPRRRLAAAAGVLTALAAAALLWVMRAPPAPPPYDLSLIRGAIVETRSDAPDPTAELYRVDDEATLTLTLTPTAALDNAPLYSATYTACAAPRARASTQGTLGPDGAWTLTAPARALFADRYGPCTLEVALTHDPDHLDPLDEDAVRWYRIPFDYRPSDAR